MNDDLFEKYILCHSCEYVFEPREAEKDWIVFVQLFRPLNSKNIFLPRLYRRERLIFENNDGEKEQKLVWVEDFNLWSPDDKIVAETVQEALAILEENFKKSLWQEYEEKR